MWLKHRKYSVHEKHERSHTAISPLLIISYSTCHFPPQLSSTRPIKNRTWSFLVVCWLRADEFFFFFFFSLCLTVVCWFAEKRPQRCIDWWEGMIYVAPVSQLSSGPLSLITAIRLPLHRRSPCLRPAITTSLLSHIHKGKGRILSPRLPLQRYRDAKKGASMCSGELKVIIYLIIAWKAFCYPRSRGV